MVKVKKKSCYDFLFLLLPRWIFFLMKSLLIIHLKEKKSFMEVFNVLKQDNKQATVMGNTDVNSLLLRGLVFCWTTLFNSHPVPHTCKQTAWRKIENIETITVVHVHRR